MTKVVMNEAIPARDASLEVLEEKLTDGSKVYDVSVRPDWNAARILLVSARDEQAAYTCFDAVLAALKAAQ